MEGLPLAVAVWRELRAARAGSGDQRRRQEAACKANWRACKRAHALLRCRRAQVQAEEWAAGGGAALHELLQASISVWWAPAIRVGREVSLGGGHGVGWGGASVRGGGECESVCGGVGWGRVSGWGRGCVRVGGWKGEWGGGGWEWWLAGRWGVGVGVGGGGGPKGKSGGGDVGGLLGWGGWVGFGGEWEDGWGWGGGGVCDGGGGVMGDE